MRRSIYAIVLSLAVGILLISSTAIAQWEPRPERIQPYSGRINVQSESYRTNTAAQQNLTQQERIQRSKQREREREQNYYFMNPHDFRWTDQQR
ncbi:MAG: hypothetical protein HN337_00220 [Deltaproteobacteria bacterium]|nr:hypothetical protein [Deltaproteobacteria bacterium]